MTSIVFPRQYKNRFANFLNRWKYKRILEMLKPYKRSKLRLLDVGCGKGFLTHILSDSFDTVGVEIRKAYLMGARAMRCNSSASFLAGTVENLPFNNGSFDLILCTSILEHLQQLDTVLPRLKSLLSERGVLIVGYPVETWVFKTIWRVTSPDDFRFIDQKHPENVKDYWSDPGTHKQTYLSIRKALNEQFKTCKVTRLPFTVLPSLFAYYECAILQARSNR